MKIFYPLLCYYPSESGGPANAIYWLNKALGQYNIHSTVVSTKFGLLKEPVGVNDLYKRYNINIDFISGTIFSFLNKKQLLKLREADCIHFSSLFFKPTIFYLILGLSWSKKIIISPRGELYEAALARNSIKKYIYLEAIKIFQKKIKFHATNSFEKKLIEKYFPRSKGVVEIPNFIERPKVSHIKVQNQILFLGRINPIKNIHVLIEAYNQLPRNLKLSFSLAIAGEARLDYEKIYLNTLKALTTKLNLSKNVNFLGGIYGKQKEEILSQSFCTVLPSKSENFGNVVLESLCQGTPAIVTKHAPWEILEEYCAGYWIEPTVSNIKNSITHIVSLKKTNYDLIRMNALTLVTEKFDIYQNINKWIDFYLNPINLK